MSIPYKTVYYKNRDYRKIIGYEEAIGKRLTLPEWLNWRQVIEIGDGVFYGNTDMEELVIPDSVDTIGRAVFYGCRNLRHIMFSNHLRKIQEAAFAYCEGLEWAVLPGSLKEIGRMAFCGCRNMAECEIPGSVKKVGEGAFAGTGLISINVPAACVSLGEQAFRGCRNLQSIQVDAKNPVYSSKDGVLFDKEGKCLLSYPVGKTEEFYTVPDGTEEIADYAFYALAAATSLRVLIFPSSLKRIGTCAFVCTNLRTVWFKDPYAAERVEGFAEAFRDNLNDKMEVKWL